MGFRIKKKVPNVYVNPPGIDFAPGHDSFETTGILWFFVLTDLINPSIPRSNGDTSYLVSYFFKGL